MHKIVKGMSNSSINVDDQTKAEVPALEQFFEDVRNRVEERREITPEFLNDASAVTQFSKEHLYDLDKALIECVYDNFDKCNLETLCFTAYSMVQGQDQDEQMDDFTKMFMFRLSELIIEGQDHLELSNEAIYVLPSLLYAVELENVEVNKATEKMLIKFYKDEEAMMPSVETLVSNMIFINKAIGTEKNEINGYFFGVMQSILSQGICELEGLYMLSKNMANFFPKFQELYDMIINAMCEKNYNIDTLREELSDELIVQMFCNILSNPTDKAVLIDLAEQVFENCVELQYFTTLRAYRLILTSDIFDDRTKTHLASSLSNRLEKWRHLMYKNEYESHKTFEVSPLNQTQNDAVIDMIYNDHES